MRNENISLRRKGDRRLIENPRTTEHLDPIIEYAQEPLLSLVQACIPLMNIIPNLPKYVEIALRETPNEPPDGLTYDESASIRLYTIEWEEDNASLYLNLNMTLKKSDRQLLRPYYRYLKLLLTALIKLPSAPLQTVWRGVNKNLSAEFVHETRVTWWAFSSCTISLTVLENNVYLSNTGERTLFSVEAMNGRIIRAHSHFDFEDEVILLPGTYMEVHSQLTPAPGLHIIHLKQIKPRETLLALPFEGYFDLISKQFFKRFCLFLMYIDALLYPPEIKIKPWYQKKRTIIELSILIILCYAGIIIGLVFGTRPTLPPESNVHHQSYIKIQHFFSFIVCKPRPLGITVDLLWSFDCSDAREDLKGVYNGTAINGATYSSPDFSNRGKALNLNRRRNQYIELPRSLNLSSNTSFTVSLWKFSTNYNQATILIDCNPLNSICIEFFIVSVNIYARVYSWYNQTMSYLVTYEAWKVNYQSCWIHLAFAFDFRMNQLTIFFNGEPMATNTFYPNYFPQIKANERLSTLISSNSYPFDGLIDQLTVSYYRKNDSEIRREATLLCSYDFESDDINHDNGPNNIQAYSEHVYYSQEQTLRFNSSDSYFQTSGFTLMMSNSYAFTIAFWIRPILLPSDKENSAIALFQLSSKVQQVTTETYVCFLTFYIVNITSSQPTFRMSFGQLNMYMQLDDIQIKNNTWTHVLLTYFDKSQLFVFINGKDYRGLEDDRFSLLLSAPRFAVTIGGNYFDDIIETKPTNYESRACFAERPEFNFMQMNGQIDELKFFSRKLTRSEINELASSKNISNLD